MTTQAPDGFALGTAQDPVPAQRAVKATDRIISSILAMDIPAAEFVPRNVAVPSVVVAVSVVVNEFDATGMTEAFAKGRNFVITWISLDEDVVRPLETGPRDACASLG